MFKVKKKRIEGQCDAMRCTATEGLEDSVSGKLCPRHLAMEPDLTEGFPALLNAENGAGLGPDPDILEAFKDFSIESQEDYFTAASVLHDAIDGREKDDNARKEAGRPHYEPWKVVNEAYKSTLGAWDSLIETVKGRIVAARLALEEAQDRAMEEGKPLPPGLEDPPGVSVKPEIQIVVNDLSQVPEHLLKVVLDTDAVMEYVGANPRTEIAGLSVVRNYVVYFRRPNADK